MHISATIFKAYDIRGIVPSTINEDIALGLGRAFGSVARAQGETTVAVGRDGRLSGPGLAEALMRGLQEAGITVIDVGMVTTPMLYFAANTLCASGIQVTGSHNPKDYNGFKMVMAGRAIYGEDIQALRRMMEAESWNLQAGGTRRSVDVLDAYRARIVGDIRLARPLKIVVDCGNGVAGASAPAILRAIGCEVTELFSEVDGNFPNHHPDPSKPENLRDLIAALKTSDAELGLAFDGDGDRLGIVTRDGNNIYPDRQMMLFAQDVLSRVPGGTILFDVKCSQRLAPAIAAAGGVPLMFKTGHSLIKAKMKEIGSPLGGEMSGHIFFKERWFGFDDGTYAGCRLLEIVSRAADASALLNALPTSFSTPELNVPCAEGEPHAVVGQLVAKATRTAGPPQGARAPSGGSAAHEVASVGAWFPAPATVNTIDGLRVDWPDGFGLIRASNTTPVLVLRFEGHTPEALARIESAMLELLRTVKPDAMVAEAAH
ncbi:MAG: phosphomannomutase/phosphoglucomutase [Rhodoferax sp.]